MQRGNVQQVIMFLKYDISILLGPLMFYPTASPFEIVYIRRVKLISKLNIEAGDFIYIGVMRGYIYKMCMYAFVVASIRSKSYCFIT